MSVARPPETERGFQDAVVHLAKLRGWKVYHTHDSRHSEAGFPDLVMLRGERMIVAELKADNKLPTAEQEAWLEAFHVVGIPAVVWWPISWGDIERTLE